MKQEAETTNTKPLAGKVALVTGGSRGLGAAIAKRLAQDGAAVVITYSASPEKVEEVVRLIREAGGKAISIEADAADEKAVRNAVSKTVEAFGGIDILVNNAGTKAAAPIEKFAIEDFDRVVIVNVRGLFIATQEAVRHMRESGRIIHIGSCVTERMPYVGGSVYALSKGAVAAFTKGLARDLGPRRITVNNVQPGPTETDMNPAVGDHADLLRSCTALDRYAQPQEVASLVAFLARGESSFITGANLLADGGMTA